MTEAAGERFAGHDRARGARGRGGRAARGGADRAHRALRAQRALLAPLRRADRAADLAAVVHADGRARRGGARAGARRAHPDQARGPAAALRRTGWRTSGRGASPASCGGATRSPSTTAATSATWASSRRRARAGSATRTCSTPGSRASCGRSPRSAGPHDTPELRAFYPTDVLSTARDILFLWVARMVMMGLEFTGEIPFSRVNVHTVVQAPDGRRMSKSLGTGIDPLALIDGGARPPVFAEGGDFPAYGADAVRWGLLAISSSQDVRFNEERVAQGRQLANKLYNATRLVLLRLPDDARLPDVRAGARHGRGRVDPLAPAGRRARRGGGDRRVRLPRRRAARVRLRLRRAVRLVPRAAQAAPVRGGQQGDRRVRAARARPRRWRSRTR